MLKRCVLVLCLKLDRVFVDLTDSGRLFQIVGQATEKARSPNLICAYSANVPTNVPTQSEVDLDEIIHY